MELPRPFLNELPLELISEILSYLIPRGRIFRINSRRPADPNPPQRPSPYLRPKKYHYFWEKQDWLTWEDDRDLVPSYILPLLLLHPAVYQLALIALYSNNTLWFPDLHTLTFFSGKFSQAAKSAVRSLAIDACGVELEFHGCTSAQNDFEFSAEIGIAEAILKFPRLEDLRLGGIGPGVHDRVIFLDPVTGLIPDEFWRFGPTRLGALTVQRWEDGRIWPLDCITLLAQIVGSKEKSELGNDDDADLPSSQGNTIKHGSNSNPLDGARIFHAMDRSSARRAREDLQTRGWVWSSTDASRGMYRRWGTRIVKIQGEILLGDGETELVDVAEALHCAKTEAARKVDYEMHQHESHFPFYRSRCVN